MSDERAQFERDAVEFASRAVQFDKEGSAGPAAFYYREAAQALQSALLSGSQLAGISEKSSEYLDRAEELWKQASGNTHQQVSSSVQQLELDRAKFLLGQALDEDEAEHWQEALELYTHAIELCLQARGATEDKSLQEKLASIATRGLERAECLKVKLSSESTIRPAPSAPSLQGARSPGPARLGPRRVLSPVSSEALSPDHSSRLGPNGEGAQAPKSKLLVSGSDGYTREEIETVVSDCSFVASLAVSALYEKRFKKNIITSIIYPQNRQGLPVYNPCGKYTIKLNINGVPRKEDFANNREYITLLVYKNNGKKVYLPFDPPPYLDGVRINSPHYLCKMVIPQGGNTRYTLVVSQYEKSNTIHYTLRAYASCPFTLGKRLFLLKNPWSHLRWKGKYSERDTVNWTPALSQALRYDPRNAAMFDNGVFWIDYDSEKRGAWTSETAGGCGNHPETYGRNPVYQVCLQTSHDDNQMLVSLKGPKQYQIGFDVVTVTANNPSCPNVFSRKGSGMYKSGFTVMELERLPGGIYNIIPSTFMPFQEGPFFLTVSATCPFKFSRIK
ncbi:calcium-dependent cysteine protease, putative [Ixodes scapularis]|uniref:Calcium-dependent cysteine protease, putative n=1 Tax=Ixodes scapularis TaxID=6945 RepID=B7P5B6_IXOSC|nr:calcium-dependent cysteine protease, putative [Ixodes scapularis]|eukprot:XP_002407228.1 calcium-dependent cysteine protease, putative [Ixodes scapularis]